MRLSIDTSAISRVYGDEEALRLIHSCGFDCCDFSFFTMDDPLKILDDEEYVSWARHLRCIMDETGLVCNQAHAPFSLTRENYVPDLSNRYYRELVRSMECASIFGAPYIVIHPLGQENEDSYDFDLKFYKDLEQWCKTFKIKVAIENIYNEDPITKTKSGRLCNVEKQMTLVRKLGTEWFAALVDVGHAAIIGIKPEDYLRDMDPAVLCGLHVHDTDYKEDLHVPPFHACHNWINIMNALSDIGYDGDLTLEIPYYISRFDKELIPDAVNFAHKIGRYLIDTFWKNK